MIQRLLTAYPEIDAPNVLKRVASFIRDMKQNNIDYRKLNNDELKQRGYSDIVSSFGNSLILESFINANQSALSSIELKILAAKAVENPNNKEVLSEIASHFKFIYNAYNIEHQDDKSRFIPVDPYAVNRAIICKDVPKTTLVELLYNALVNQDFALFCTAGGRKVKRKETDYFWEGKGRHKW